MHQKIKKKGKLVNMTPKDLAGISEYNSVKDNKGPAKVFVSRKELKKYEGKLNFKTRGKPVLEEQSKYSKIRKAKDLARSNPAILNKLAGKEGLQLSHLSLGELDTLKNLGYLPADINIKQYHPFEKKIVAISKDIYDIQNNKDLSVSEKRMAIAQKQKEDRALRKKFPKFANTKARLTVKATGLDESGLMIKEKLPDPSIAIAPDEAGTTLKQIDSKSAKAAQITQIAKQNLSEQIKNNPQFRAKIPGLTDLFEMAKSIPDDVKKAKYLKAGFKTLGIAASPLVIYDTYKAFEQGKPILESLEQGLIGTDLIGGAKRVLSLTPEERTARSVVKQDALKDLNLDMPMGFGFIEGPTPDTDMTLEEAQAKAAAGDERVKALEAQKNLERATSRANFFGGLRDRIFGAPQSLSFAGGGIAGLSGGDTEGAMLKSMNPDKDGLQGLLKRVKKG